MAKRKIDAAMMLAAGENAHLQTKKEVSHANSIGDEKFLELDVDKIENNPMQPRIHIPDEELQELARSIKLHGLIQPISVIKAGDDRYILKAGQRRLLAHRKIGKSKIKAVVKEEVMIPGKENDRILFEIAVMENTQREQLDPLELALSLRKAMDKKLYENMEELSAAIGKSKSYISKVLKVLSLQEEIIEDLQKNKTTNDIEALYEIQRIADPNEQIRIYREFVEKRMDREAIRAYNRSKKVSRAKHPATLIRSSKRIRVELDTGLLDEESRKRLDLEIEELLKRYYGEKLLRK